MSSDLAAEAMGDGRAAAGFYCSTSGTVFSDKDAYLEHMKSDFHRYNLKRKVAGLPPVTKEWFEARKAQLATAGATASSSSSTTKLWIDPLSKKKFNTENTYLAWVRSKKFLELVKKSGEPAPEPMIIIKTEDEARMQAQQQQQQQQQQGAAPTSSFASTYKSGKPPGALKDDGSLAAIKDEDDGSGWETASDADGDADQADGADQEATAMETGGNDEEDSDKWEAWEVKKSLFDNHMSQDMDSNLDYMFRNFGFYFPDAEYLQDPEGLLKYLGAKLQYGHVPLYTKGDDENAKQFRSLHAVQRHMVDTNQCRMVYDDNEEEYAQFYEYEDEEEGKDLVVQDTPASAMILGGYELMLPGADGQGTKVLGTREFARYYRQRHRLDDSRQIVVVNTMLARYRSLGIELRDGAKSLEAKKMTTKNSKDLKWEGKRNVKTEVWSNFVKNLGKGVGREY